MTAKILTARRHVDYLHFVIHLDITKMDPLDITKPDPRWLLTRDYPIAYETGRPAAALVAIRAEITTAAQAQIARLTDEDAGGVYGWNGSAWVKGGTI